MKYLILIYSNPQSRQIWAALSAAERAVGWQEYGVLADDLLSSGELIVTEALADPSLAVRVPASVVLPLATDGPFAEAKEQLAGFFLLECATMERALEVAARVPEAAYGLVEVRPVLDRGGIEL